MNEISVSHDKNEEFKINDEDDRDKNKIMQEDEDTSSSSSSSINDNENLSSHLHHHNLSFTASSSSNRRKQSKPNRISLLEEQAEKLQQQAKQAIFDKEINQENNKNKRRSNDTSTPASMSKKPKQQNHENDEEQSNEIERHCGSASGDDETAYCTICKKEFCNKYFLKSHMTNKHGGMFEPTSTVYLGTQGSMMTHFKFNTNQPPAAPPSTTTTPNKNIKKTNKDDLTSAGTSATPSSSSSSSSSSLSPSHSIKTEEQRNNVLQTITSITDGSFTNVVEDYCDLCQKHFCNKYYLRKHKLDVHGMVIDNNIKPYKKHDKSNRKQASSSFEVPLSLTSPLTSNGGDLLNDLMRDGELSQQKQHKRKNQTGSDMNGISAKQRSSTPSQQSISCSANTTSIRMGRSPSPIPIHSSTPPPSLPIDTAAQMHHALSSSSSPSPFTIQNNAAAASYMLLNPYIMHFPHMLAAKHAAAFVAAASGLNHLPPIHTPPPMQSSFMSNHDHDQPQSTLQTKNLNIQQDQSTTTAIATTTPSNAITASATTTIKPMTNGNIDYVNCSLCSKSFCNFEYLRLHLINKHGIDPAKAKTQPQQQQQKLTTDSVRYELKLKDSDTFCFLCEKDFQTKFALKTHYLFKHQQQQQPSQTLDTSSSIDTKDNLTDTSSADANCTNMTNGGKCLDKVVCHLCNKQLCNKYFLKTHKLKVHGVKEEPSQFDFATLSEGQMQSSVSEDHQDYEDDTKSQQPNAVNDENDEKENDEGHVTKAQQSQQQQSTLNRSAYCEICNKELCNKYFLRSHMINAHNINIETSASSPPQSPQSSSLSEDRRKIESKKNEDERVENKTKQFDMQAFLIESKDKRFTDNFVSCLIYLPIKTKIDQTMTLQLQLKPYDETTRTRAPQSPAITADDSDKLVIADL